MLCTTERGYLLVKAIELPTRFTRRLLQGSMLCKIVSQITFKTII